MAQNTSGEKYGIDIEGRKRKKLTLSKNFKNNINDLRGVRKRLNTKGQ